jgi:hypothetical protein
MRADAESCFREVGTAQLLGLLSRRQIEMERSAKEEAAVFSELTAQQEYGDSGRAARQARALS